MARYRLILDEVKPHPSGIPMSELQLHLAFDGNVELINLIHSAIADTIKDWQYLQKDAKKT